MAGDDLLARARNFQLGIAEQLAAIRTKRRRGQSTDPATARLRGPGGSGLYGARTAVHPPHPGGFGIPNRMGAFGIASHIETGGTIPDQTIPGGGVPPPGPPPGVQGAFASLAATAAAVAVAPAMRAGGRFAYAVGQGDVIGGNPPALLTADFAVGVKLLTLVYDQPIQLVGDATGDVTFGDGANGYFNNQTGQVDGATWSSLCTLSGVGAAVMDTTFNNTLQALLNHLPVTDVSGFPVTIHP